MRPILVAAAVLFSFAALAQEDGEPEFVTELCRIAEGPWSASFIVGNEPDRPFPDGWLVSARDDWDFGDGNVWREVTPRHPDGPLKDEDAFWLPAAMVSCGDDIAAGNRVRDGACDAGQTFFDWPVPVFPAPDQPAKGAVMGGTELVYLDRQTVGGILWGKFSAPADGNDVGWINAARLECMPPFSPVEAAPAAPAAPSSAN